MSQIEINDNIDKLFDEFIKANGDINKMDIHGINKDENNESNKKNVRFAEQTEEIYNDHSNNSNDANNCINNTETTEDDNKFANTEIKTYFDDNSLKLDFTNSFTGDILNNFLLYFKKKNNKSNNFTLLEDIDINDPYSTNIPLEEMFFELSTFIENEKINPKLCEIIPFEHMDREMVNNEEVYCMMIDNKPAFVSRSFFALLIELTNIKSSNSQKFSKNPKDIQYDIISLK